MVFFHCYDSLTEVIQYQWEFQEPKLNVLYNTIRPYFVWISPYIGLTQALYMVDRE